MGASLVVGAGGGGVVEVEVVVGAGGTYTAGSVLVCFLEVA